MTNRTKFTAALPNEGEAVGEIVGWQTGRFQCPKCGPVHHARNCDVVNCSAKGTSHGHCIMCDEETVIPIQS